MSQVHYQGISLEELIGRSQLVLIVKPARPPQRQVEIPIGKDAEGHDAPAFVRVLSRYAVQSALSASGKELVGKTIEIDGAHWRQSLSMHQSYYLRGVSKSPIYQQYHSLSPSADSEPKDAPLIVFLTREGDDGYAFVVDGATESMRNRATVENLLRRPK